MLLATSLLAFVGVRAFAADTWDFTPPEDTFSPDALLDLRSLNEQVAGESGFITRSADGNGFVLGNGKPIRFWALMDNADEKHPLHPAPDLAKHARFLAKRGINLVRFFEDISSDQRLDAIDEPTRDRLWRTVAAMKKEGIYVLFTPIWLGASRTKPELGFLATQGGKAGGLLYDHQLQAAYKSWMKQTLTVPNPYTGIPLAQDPALAIIQIHNEESLLWWSSQGIKGPARLELKRQFWEFLKAKYGSADKAPDAWQGAVPPADQDGADDFAHQQPSLYIVWELTQHRGGPGEQQRCADQMEWLTTTQHGWYQEIADYLRKDLGCKQLINASNWKTADNVTMMDAERWSYTPGEVMAVNRYYTGIHNGKNCGWAICVGDEFTDPSVLTRPRSLPITLKQVDGCPIVVTESSWVPPLSYQSEGPMLISAYQSLTGVAGYFWFATSEERWNEYSIDKSNGFMPSQGKWICATPMLMGQFPAAALLYRKGYLKLGEPVVHEQRALADLWARSAPIIAEDEGYDPNHNAGLMAKTSNIQTGVDPLAYLVGPVRVSYGGDPAKSTVADVKKFIDHEAKTVVSETGELHWDYGNGFCTMNAPKAQGATGFWQKVKGAAKLADVDITCRNAYATVMTVSMDDSPIASAATILVQVGTREHATGWSTKPVKIKEDKDQVPGEQITSFGHSPWQIEDADIDVAIRNSHLTKATVLDCNGMPTREAKLAKTSNGVTFTFPKDALYVVLH
jgi:hypothetical protein